MDYDPIQDGDYTYTSEDIIPLNEDERRKLLAQMPVVKLSLFEFLAMQAEPFNYDTSNDWHKPQP